MSSRGNVRGVPEYAVGSPRNDVRRARFDATGAPGARICFCRLRGGYGLHRPLSPTAHLGSFPPGKKPVERLVVIAGFLASFTRTRHRRGLPPVVAGPERVSLRPASVTTDRVSVRPAQIHDGVACVRELRARVDLHQSARAGRRVGRVGVPPALARNDVVDVAQSPAAMPAALIHCSFEPPPVYWGALTAVFVLGVELCVDVEVDVAV